jgi:topoisomerase IA-like protein
LARQTKQTFGLADTTEYSLVFNTYGASLKRELEDGTTEYCKVKPDIELDLEKAKRGEYTMTELIWREDDGILGTYNDSPVHLKKGKYGFYVEWKEKTYSLKGAAGNGLADAIKVISAKENKMSNEDATSMFLPVGTLDGEDARSGSSSSSRDKSIVRSLRTDLSIRKGKFGNYIYHKTTLMSKPSFYPLNSIKEKWQQMADLELIAWIENTYRVSI